MIDVRIPKHHLKEKEYIIHILLTEFLGLEYQINISEAQNYEIMLENGHCLIFQDYFFAKVSQEHTYLDTKNIPDQVFNYTNPFLLEKDIPVIYGTDHLEVTEKKIVCGIDIFASAFFMLSRWEEHVNKARDKHQRFPATASLAYQQKFLLRPLVNEYVEMLWNMLKYLGFHGTRKMREFAINATHDVDRPYRYVFKGLPRVGKDMLQACLKKEFMDLCPISANYLKVKMGQERHDPYNTFDLIMDISEQNNISSTFYFITDFKCSTDGVPYSLSHPKITKILEKILKRGHTVGLHGSYLSYNDVHQYQKEYTIVQDKLQQLGVDNSRIAGRQHFLRYDIVKTPGIHEAAGLCHDSSLGYPDHVGFRSGTCYEYSMFDIIARRKLEVKQRPLIVMEGSLLGYMGLTFAEAANMIKTLKMLCLKHKGIFTILWHNDSLASAQVLKLYKEIF